MIRTVSHVDLILGKSARRSRDMKARRWEAAETHRLNAAHWERVTGQPINSDLSSHLETLRNRCEYEAFNNSHFDGIVNTYETDVVGRNGPTLQVRSSRGKSYNSRLEAIWQQVWSTIDINGMCNGADRMKQWIRMKLITGEFLEQIVTDETAVGPVKFRLQAIHPRRLQSSAISLGDANIILGVERTKTGKPIKYHILEETTIGGSVIFAGTTIPIAAKDIIHGFKILEPGQARGVPRLASILSAIADVRDFDAETLEGARQAAAHSVLLTTTDVNANPITVNESETVEIERGVAQTMPPGWTPTQMVPQQPSARYVEFRTERHGDMGQPLGMPGIKVRHDATKSNFASARFDNGAYRESVSGEQGWLERNILDPLVEKVRREATLAAALPTVKSVEYSWDGWPVAPVIDEVKRAAADKMDVEGGVKSLSSAIRGRGQNPDVVIAEREQDNDKLKKAKLPLVAVSKQAQPPRQNSPSAPANPRDKGTPKLARQDRFSDEIDVVGHNGNGRHK